jgi:hypothetical protein
MECAMSSDAHSWTCSISLKFRVAGQFSEPQRFGPEITRKEQVKLNYGSAELKGQF